MKSRGHCIGLFGYETKEGCRHRTLHTEVQSYRSMKATKDGQEENEGRIGKYVGMWILTLSPSHNRLVFMLTRLIPDTIRECAAAATLLTDRNSWEFLTL